jgi:hypothetical protein
VGCDTWPCRKSETMGLSQGATHSTPRPTLSKPQRAAPARSPARRCRSRGEAGWSAGLPPAERASLEPAKTALRQVAWVSSSRPRRPGRHAPDDRSGPGSGSTAAYRLRCLFLYVCRTCIIGTDGGGGVSSTSPGTPMNRRSRAIAEITSSRRSGPGDGSPRRSRGRGGHRSSRSGPSSSCRSTCT